MHRVMFTSFRSHAILFSFFFSIFSYFIRLYCRAKILGFKRGMRTQQPNTSLIEIEGVKSKKDAAFYLGKRVAYVYRAKRAIKGSKIRCIWGRLTRPHGNNGVLRAKFSTNLPPRTSGASCRVMLYPSRV
jgi:large subunit ribosomal protein L35Ae